MKMKTLAMLAGVGAPLIATASAPAGFLGITVEGKANEFGYLVCNVYANFDREGEDFMQAVAGTIDAPMLVQVVGGVFLNFGLGSNTAPTVYAISLNARVAFDTFVTIGAKISDPDALPDALNDATVITPGFPGLNGSQLSTNASGWAVTPIDPQGDPWNEDYGGPGSGKILIAQFSTDGGTAIFGTFLVQYVSNGAVGQSVVSFFHVPTPGTLALLGAAGLIGARRRRRS